MSPADQVARASSGKVLSLGFSVCAIASSFLGVPAAAADLGPPAVVVSSVVGGLDPGSSTPPQGTSNQSSFVDTASGAASASASVSPSVFLTATAHATGCTLTFCAENSADSTAFVQYFVEVVGPSDIVIPLRYVANLSTFGSFQSPTIDPFSVGHADAQFAIGSDFELNSVDIFACSGGSAFGGDTCSGVPASVAASGSLPVLANGLNNVIEEISVNTSEAGMASASADPFFFIDPDFLLNNPGYSVVVSDGVGNSPLSAIPEPETWATMLMGLFGVGVVLRSAMARRTALQAGLA